MYHHTPMRYPGGKRRLYEVVTRLLEENELHDISYVEPFAGGAGIAIGLLFDEYASAIHLNDLSRPVYALWHTILNKTDWLCEKIERLTVSMPAWRRHRAVYRRRASTKLAELGLSALFLNRTNRSGIMGGGVIGGKHQDGDWTLDVRFNKADLINRIKKIARYRDRIHLYRMDGCTFTESVVPTIKNAFLFYDPPYIEISRCLYLNDYTIEDHRRLAECVHKLRQPWIVTYDCAAIQRRLYSPYRRIVYGLHYMAHEKHKSEEVMFFSDGLKLPAASELVVPRMVHIPTRSRIHPRRIISGAHKRRARTKSRRHSLCRR